MSKTKYLIIGTGFGGIEMAVALQKAGIDDFVMLEKGNDIGGVWRDNQYLGCSCDVPSHLYSFSFSPYKSKERRFPPQQEILFYLRQVASDFQLWKHICLNTAVAQAAFQETQGRWYVTTSCGEVYDAEIVIFAVGQLQRPHFADIPGREDFLGPQLHPAVWDDDVNLQDKQIAIIGTGSSAAQMLPSLASIAQSVTVFQRSPAWILPKASSDFGRLSRCVLRIPGAHFVYRKALYYGADVLLSPLTQSRHQWLRHTVEAVARCHLHRQVKDPTLRQKLTPSYPIGTKRILFDSHFYPALSLPNVQLITSLITQITLSGVLTADGTHHPCDILISATGFKAAKFLTPITITGCSGRNLNDEWANGAEAFLGVAVHGYPSLFMIAGPNTFNPAGSNPGMKEVQVGFIMRCLRWREEMGGGAIEVRTGAVEGYREWLAGKMEETVWMGAGSEVKSWYKHESGKVVNPWPASARRFKRVVKGVEVGECFQVVGKT